MREWPKIVQARKRPERIYLRFGRWDKRSYNWGTGAEEIGVSVYPAKFDGDLVELDCELYARDWVALAGRCVWAVTGQEVGTGSDGEPLLRGVVARQYAISSNGFQYTVVRLRPDGDNR